VHPRVVVGLVHASGAAGEDDGVRLVEVGAFAAGVVDLDGAGERRGERVAVIVVLGSDLVPSDDDARA
jgi:hypothetical protein